MVHSGNHSNYTMCFPLHSASPTGPLKFEAYAAPTTPTPVYTGLSVSGGTSPSFSRPKQDTPPTPRTPNPLTSSVTLPLPDRPTETVEERAGSYGTSGNR